MEDAGERSVIVTFTVDEPLRDIIEEVIGAGEVRFIHGLSLDSRSKALKSGDVVIAWDIQNELFDNEWELLRDADLIQMVWAGVDGVPFDRIPAGPRIAANAGAYAGQMAEHALGLILALAERFCQQHEKLRGGFFDIEAPKLELRGSTCGILGLGGVGQAVAHLATALGMHIMAINRAGKTAGQVDFVGTLADLDHVLINSHVVAVTLPLTKATRGLIGRRELGLMRPDAILVNVARAAVVDEDALYGHLCDHPRFMAGLDVWWEEPSEGERFHVRHPFFDLPNLLGSPHNSGIVKGWRETGVRRAAENVRRYLNEGGLSGLVRREDYLD